MRKIYQMSKIFLQPLKWGRALAILGYFIRSLFLKIFSLKLVKLSDSDFFNKFLDKEFITEKEGILKYYRTRENTKTFPTLTVELSQERVDMIVSRAQEIMQHRFQILGQSYQFHGEIDWSSDFSGQSWMKRSCKELKAKLYKNDFQNEDYIGDIKIPWEFNKHLHFVTLGQAYVLTNDEGYAREFISEISDWIDKNHYDRNVAWMEPLIVSQRVISWCFALNLFLNAESLTQEVFIKILKSLMQQAYYIENHLEFSLYPSNHLIGNLVGLFVLAAFYPEFRRSDKWYKMSLKLLNREIKQQVYSDGVDYEQSIGYHKYVVDFCLLPAIFARFNSKVLPPSFMEKLEKMLEFLMHVSQPNGLTQPIGDADGARVWDLSHRDINDCRASLAIGALVFGRGDFKSQAEDAIEDVQWIFGKSSLHEYRDIESQIPPEASKAFFQGGYYIMRTGWNKDDTWLCFDCGNVGMGRHNKYESLGLHGHDDILNFCLYAKGRRLITDIGSYTYTGSKKWHDYFRSSKSHNLLIINDEDESIHTKTWTLKSIARPRFGKWYSCSDFDYAFGGHDGYRRFKSPIDVNRHILFLKKMNKIIIKDEVLGDSQSSLSLYFHLAAKVEPINSRAMKYDLGDGVSIECFLTQGLSQIMDSYYSPNYGVKLETKTIIYKVDLATPARIYTLIDLRSKRDYSAERIERLFNEHKPNQ